MVLPWNSIGMNSLVIKTKQQLQKKIKICRQIALLVLVLVLVRVHTLAAFRSEYEDDYEYEF